MNFKKLKEGESAGFPGARPFTWSSYDLNNSTTGPGSNFTQAIKRDFFSAGVYGCVSASNRLISFSPPQTGDSYRVHLKAFGHHARPDLFDGAKVTDSHSQFDIASITKVFVAIMVLHYVTTGELGFDRKVTDFFPKLRVIGTEKPTIGDLLKYGVRFQLDHLISPYWDYDSQQLRQELEKASVSVSNFNYSNYPPIILAFILEKITGRKIKDIITEQLFNPLGMNSVFCDYDGSGSSQKVGSGSFVCTEILAGEQRPLEGMVHDPFTRVSRLNGAAGVFASIEDLLIFGRFLLEKGSINGSEFVKHEFMMNLGQNQFDANGSSTPFGLGFGLWNVFARGFDPMHDEIKKAGLPLDFSKGAYFKNGFTGVTIACFPKIDTAVAVSTNMMHPLPHRGSNWKHRFLFTTVMSALTGSNPMDAKMLWGKDIQEETLRKSP